MCGECAKGRSFTRHPGVFLRIELSGSGYSTELEQELRESLGEKYPVLIRGERTPAAGPELLVAILVEPLSSAVGVIVEELPGAAVSMALAATIGHVKKAVRHCHEKKVKRGERDGFPPPPEGYVNKITVAMPTYDLVVRLIPDGDLGVDRYDIGGIVDLVDEFVRRENARGPSVLRVSLPCEVSTDGSGSYVLEGHGNPLLWRVKYRDGDKWPEAVYDAEHGCFLSGVRPR